MNEINNKKIICFDLGLCKNIFLVKNFEYILDNIKDKYTIVTGNFFYYFKRDINIYKKYLENMKSVIMILN